jgi:hypothetical protein
MPGGCAKPTPPSKSSAVAAETMDVLFMFITAVPPQKDNPPLRLRPLRLAGGS